MKKKKEKEKEEEKEKEKKEEELFDIVILNFTLEHVLLFYASRLR